MDSIRHFFDDFYKSLEIYFDKEIIFPYTLLEEMQQQHRMYNDCNIYMLLLADKLELVSVRKKTKYIRIKYKNLVTGKRLIARLEYESICSKLWGILLPRKCLKISIVDFGMTLRVELCENNMELFMYYPYMNNLNAVFEICIYDVLNLCTMAGITKERREILYIGKSNPQDEYKTIYDRLRKHEKVLDVFKRYNIDYRDKELMVFLGHTKSKLHNKSGIVCLGNSKWQEYDTVGEIIDDTSIVDVTEAMLIYHFKPEYNIKLKDSMPNIRMKTYNQFDKAGIDRIDLGLNLYLQDYKRHIILVTDEQQCCSKLRILKCFTKELHQEQQEMKIYYEDISDEEYEILGM